MARSHLLVSRCMTKLMFVHFAAVLGQCNTHLLSALHYTAATDIVTLLILFAGLRYPDFLLQILDMSDTELSHLARHLGHDTKTHKEFYRLSASTVQLSKVCLSLLTFQAT